MLARGTCRAPLWSETRSDDEHAVSDRCRQPKGVGRSAATWIVLFSMIGMLGGCATGGPMATTEQVVTERQRLMKQQGANMQMLQAKVKAGNLDAAAVYVKTLVVTSQQILQLFPKGSTSDRSRAKPLIWEKWSEFAGYVSSLQTQAMHVADLARKQDKASAEAAVAEMGRTTCVACHDAFRGPPHRS